MSESTGPAEPTRTAKLPVSPALAGPYGHPYHPILVTVPIGSWVASVVFDLGSRFVPEPGGLVTGASWLIAIGLAGAVLAATTGFVDLLAIPVRTRAFRTAVLHMSLNLTVALAYGLNLAWRFTIDESDTATAGVPIGPLVLSVVSLLLLTVAGFLGGKLAFRYGVRVATEADQDEGFRRLTPGAPGAPGNPPVPLPHRRKD